MAAVSSHFLAPRITFIADSSASLTQKAIAGRTCGRKIERAEAGGKQRTPLQSTQILQIGIVDARLRRILESSRD
jgi:hypothetical protein